MLCLITIHSPTQLQRARKKNINKTPVSNIFMNIKTYLNATKNDVESKKFNIFIGLSLGNKLFNKESIREYIQWALNFSKEKVVVLIADKIHAVNYEVRRGYPKERAFSVALRKGKEIERLIERVLSNLLEKEKNRVVILHWQDIINEEYIRKLDIIYKAFRENKEFHKRILEIVKENTNSSIIYLKDGDYEKLAQYSLDEIPLLVCGFSYSDIQYNLIPYPGIGKIDTLAVDLQEGNDFPSITNDLQIQSKVAILEAYPDSIEYVINWENIYIKETKNRGKSIFAKKDFKKGEVVFVIGGPIVRKPSIYTIPIDYDVFIDPLHMAGKELCHSCEPNCGIKNKVKVVAMKSIKKDEEITIDYAMIVYNYGREMTQENRACKCGSKKCRGKLGAFKEIPENFKKNYEGFISEYMIEKTARAK